LLATEEGHSSSDGGPLSSGSDSKTNKGGNGDGGSSSNNHHHGGGSGQTALNTFKLLLLAMMVLQNSSTVLVGRYTRAGVPKEELYNVNHLILVCELAKLFGSAVLEFYTTQGKLWHSLQTHVLQRPLDALKITVPALLYLVQNTLLYVALSNLTAPIFQVTYQGKLVTTALVSVVMLQRVYTAQQWVCLVVLSVGVAIVVLGEGGDNKKPSTSSSSSTSTSSTGAGDINQQNLAVGLVAVTIACFSSALAGVYFEKVLKKPSQDIVVPASLWMRNMQLAFFSVVIAAGQGMYQSMTTTSTTSDGAAAASQQSYLHGFTFWTWVLVALQAGGGLLVAAVIKYADNVLKGLATGVSVVFATVLSVILFGTPLTGQFSIGAVMILSSVYIFSNPVKTSTLLMLGGGGKAKHSQTEMKGLLPK